MNRRDFLQGSAGALTGLALSTGAAFAVVHEVERGLFPRHAMSVEDLDREAQLVDDLIRRNPAYIVSYENGVMVVRDRGHKIELASKDAFDQSGVSVDDGAPSAFEALKVCLQNDPDYAWAWHCNLTMAIFDRLGETLVSANEAGAAIMLRFFDIDIEKSQYWQAGKRPIGGSANKRIENLQNCIDIQKQPGNWDYDPYMLGLLNGMLLALATIKGEDETYRPYSAPARWRADKYNEKGLEHEPPDVPGRGRVTAAG